MCVWCLFVFERLSVFVCVCVWLRRFVCAFVCIDGSGLLLYVCVCLCMRVFVCVCLCMFVYV